MDVCLYVWLDKYVNDNNVNQLTNLILPSMTSDVNAHAELEAMYKIANVFVLDAISATSGTVG